MNANRYFGNSFNSGGTWLSGKESLCVVDMHYARDVVVGQMDTLVVSDVVFDGTKTLSLCRVFIELLEDDLFLVFSREGR